MNDSRRALRLQKRREQPDAMAISPWNFMFRQRMRFRTHHRRFYFRSDFQNPFHAAIQIFGNGLKFPARFRQPFVTDAVIRQIRRQNRAVKLHPTRPRDASHIAQKSDFVFPKQREKILPGVSSVSDAVNCNLFQNYFFLRFLEATKPSAEAVLIHKPLQKTSAGREERLKPRKALRHYCAV